MLITQKEEISAYLPTSVYNDPEGLLSLVEDAEENYLVPILGNSLYNKVGEEYERLLSEHGSVLPAAIPKSEETKPVRIVRLCQMVTIYFSLANNTGLLSLSFNDGGGFNKVSTDGYDSPDAKEIERFERDAYFKARRGIDRLLIFLEEDARSEAPEFADLWRESPYFYLQGDLLFTTAIEMDRFLNIERSREKFISMLPDIRYCQDTYIAPAIGEELTEAIIRSCTDMSVIPSTDKAKLVWRKATDYLRMALAIYVENRRPEKQRRYSENEAAMSLARSKEYISKNQSEFGEYMVDSPLYVPPKINQPDKEEEPKFDNSATDNAIFVFGGKGLNRH